MVLFAFPMIPVIAYACNPSLSKHPGRAHGLVEIRVGVVIADDTTRLGVPLQTATDFHGKIGEDAAG